MDTNSNKTTEVALPLATFENRDFVSSTGIVGVPVSVDQNRSASYLFKNPVIPCIGQPIVASRSQYTFIPNEVMDKVPPSHAGAPYTGGVNAGAFGNRSGHLTAIMFVAFPGRLELPLMMPTTPSYGQCEDDYCKSDCASTMYFVGERRLDIPLFTSRMAERSDVTRIKDNHAASRSGEMLSLFCMETWLEKQGFQRVEIEEVGAWIPYYQLGTLRSRIYDADRIATFEGLHELCRSGAFKQRYPHTLVNFRDNGLRLAAFLYALKWMVNSLALDGSFRPACCGEMARIIDIDKMLRFMQGATLEETKIYYSIILNCDTLEDIYYACVQGLFSLYQLLQKVRKELFFVLHTVDVDRLVAAFGVHSSKNHASTCYGFLGRDYKWHSLGITMNVPHFPVDGYLSWEVAVKCSDLSSLLGYGSVAKPGSFDYSMPSMYETWHVFMDLYQHNAFVRDYYVRLRDYYDMGNPRPRVFRMLLVPRENVPLYFA